MRCGGPGGSVDNTGPANDTHAMKGFRLDTVSTEAEIVMNAILVLLAVSAIVGLILGFYFSWMTILASGLILAIVSAAVLQQQGYSFFAGIAIIVFCLTVNQVAYLVGVSLVTRGPRD
jgi:hypothetical protein